ncbi:preprotein translocase subunit SecG [Candidatus Liberibacter africanus]|uniref:Protein-export membrane protein SecG n=1 Tax=Candidatus Liberibacter africanus PTSAPSY TaxID=1277257 RepID=A0A0G3I5I4_LIBAF|nr:preprotein translocase subunit SecG [Candidatus Liberibacter africanus]AKK19728.1 hypothetical protein G293_00365 [Candidatus Liberibacter africanus PTSAPSY]QTP63611.1 preprotein translocase subunit SecG [Candidatus Liberibacter africanus]
MQIFLIVAHLIVVFILVSVILIQSSDSSAFGSSSSSSNFTSVRSSAHSLWRFTAIIAFFFFATSLALGITSRYFSLKNKEALNQSLIDLTKNQVVDNSSDANYHKQVVDNSSDANSHTKSSSKSKKSLSSAVPPNNSSSSKK